VSSSAIKEVSATGDVTVVDTYLREVILTATSDTATLVLRAGGSGGEVKLRVSAVANTSRPVTLHGSLFSDGVHATFTGTTPSATLVYG